MLDEVVKKNIGDINEVHDNMFNDDNIGEDHNIMEDNDNYIMMYDGINNLIHDTSAPMDENETLNYDAKIHDHPLIDLSNKLRYEGSNTSLLSIICCW
jgi:hypothetical protein